MVLFDPFVVLFSCGDIPVGSVFVAGLHNAQPNGVVTTSQYDDLNRLTRLTHAKAGNTLADFQYQLNAVNNITQMIDGAGTHNYTHGR